MVPSKEPMKKLLVITVVVLAFGGASCSGGSSATTPPPPAPKHTGAIKGPTNLAPHLDAAARARLLKEYDSALIPLCTSNGSCPGNAGSFLTGRSLLAALNRVNPTERTARVPASVPLNLNPRLVYVLADSTTNRLDIATTMAGGYYVHLIAVGGHPPHFRFGPA
jgi:hypothetical protein